MPASRASLVWWRLASCCGAWVSSCSVFLWVCLLAIASRRAPPSPAAHLHAPFLCFFTSFACTRARARNCRAVAACVGTLHPLPHLVLAVSPRVARHPWAAAARCARYEDSEGDLVLLSSENDLAALKLHERGTVKVRVTIAPADASGPAAAAAAGGVAVAAAALPMHRDRGDVRLPRLRGVDRPASNRRASLHDDDVAAVPQEIRSVSVSVASVCACACTCVCVRTLLCVRACVFVHVSCLCRVRRLRVFCPVAVLVSQCPCACVCRCDSSAFVFLTVGCL